MKIDNEFTVSVPVEEAWQALTDLAGVSLCLPGARLIGVEGGVYSGEVRVKVGPVVSEYSGTAQFEEKDDASHRAVIDAKGRESRGAGNASAAITMVLRADGQRTVVTVDTDLKISGKIAQLGGGMIKEVSEKLLGQFVECLEAKLATPAPSEMPAAAAPSEPLASETVAVDQGDHAPAAGPVETVPAPVQLPPQEPLDLLSLAGGSMTKRLVPLLIVVAAVVAVVVYLIAR
jgi:carbon monoxide dehydrogenase subunit G